MLPDILDWEDLTEDAGEEGAGVEPRDCSSWLSVAGRVSGGLADPDPDPKDRLEASVCCGEASCWAHVGLGTCWALVDWAHVGSPGSIG